jgi:L-lysine exporter family protein LysE/ArgO
MTPYLDGLLLQAGMIFALGSQNIFVFESGILKRNHLLVATISAICDTLLVFIGVLGAASIFKAFPPFKVLVGVAGTGFLLFYGLLKFRDAFSDKNLLEMSGAAPVSRAKVVAMTLAFSLLNPHVILDTVIIVGGFSARYDLLVDRAVFGAGACTTSIIWFFGLSIFSYRLRSVLLDPKVLRVVMFLAGLILTAMSIRLGLEVVQWYQEL